MGGSTLKTLAVVNMIDGCIVVLFQLAMLITLHDWVDWICIGFWGGGLMVITGLWALQKHPKRMMKSAGLAIFSGLCLVGFYSWHVSTVDCKSINNNNNINTTTFLQDMTRSSSWEKDSTLCDWRLASDIIFIIFGLMTIGINIFLAATISSAIGDLRGRSSSSSSPPHHPHPQPTSPVPPQVIYVTANNPGYPPHVQQHQEPSYPPYYPNPTSPPPPENYKH